MLQHGYHSPHIFIWFIYEVTLQVSSASFLPHSLLEGFSAAHFHTACTLFPCLFILLWYLLCSIDYALWLSGDEKWWDHFHILQPRDGLIRITLPVENIYSVHSRLMQLLKKQCSSVSGCKLCPDVKCTKQMRFYFLCNGTYWTLSAIPLRRRCQRSKFKANANDEHTEASMGACQGLWDHCLKKKSAAPARDGDTQADTFKQKRDHWVLLAFRQTNCLEIIEPQKWRWGDFLKFIYSEKGEKRRQEDKMQRDEKSERSRSEWRGHLDRVIEIGETRAVKGHVN